MPQNRRRIHDAATFEDDCALPFFATKFFLCHAGFCHCCHTGCLCVFFAYAFCACVPDLTSCLANLLLLRVCYYCSCCSCALLSPSWLLVSYLLFFYCTHTHTYRRSKLHLHSTAVASSAPLLCLCVLRLFYILKIIGVCCLTRPSRSLLFLVVASSFYYWL